MGRAEEQAYRDAKKAAVEALKKAGRSSAKVSASNAAVQRACELAFDLRRLEQESTQAYFLRVARVAKKAAITAVVAAPRTPREFRQLQVKKHPREAEIDALPRQISMPWDGTGVFWRQEA